MKHQWKLALAATALAASVVAPTSAVAFDSLVVFGDSLSDSGNVSTATAGLFPPPPYAGRFSNGPVAVEYMKDLLGLPLVNNAWGGATTGSAFALPGNPAQASPLRPNYVNYAYLNPTPPYPALPNMSDTVGYYLAATGGAADPNALYVVWGGANDVFLAQDDGRLASDPAAVLTEAVTNVTRITSVLGAVGAQHILVVGMPDLGLTPAFASDPGGASALANSFNAGLLAALGAYGPTGKWQYFDTFTFLDTVVANPAAYGFTNVTAPCFDGVSSVCADPSHYLFWDSVHPTTAGHAVLGAAFAAAVPEPETYALMLAGLAVLGVLVRRHAAA